MGSEVPHLFPPQAPLPLPPQSLSLFGSGPSALFGFYNFEVKAIHEVETSACVHVSADSSRGASSRPLSTFWHLPTPVPLSVHPISTPTFKMDSSFSLNPGIDREGMTWLLQLIFSPFQIVRLHFLWRGGLLQGGAESDTQSCI
jgi:hypothetical protein